MSPRFYSQGIFERQTAFIADVSHEWRISEQKEREREFYFRSRFARRSLNRHRHSRTGRTRQ